MLGNIWEWCKDDQREYAEASEIDPAGPQEDRRSRVLHRGSWGRAARFTRRTRLSTLVSVTPEFISQEPPKKRLRY